MEEQKQKQLRLHLKRLESTKTKLRDNTILLNRVVSSLESCTDSFQKQQFLRQKMSYESIINLTNGQIDQYEAQLRNLINMDEAAYQSVYPRRVKRSHSEERDREDTTNQDNIVHGRRKRVQTSFYSSDHSSMVKPLNDISIQVYHGDHEMAQYESAKREEARWRQRDR